MLKCNDTTKTCIAPDITELEASCCLCCVLLPMCKFRCKYSYWIPFKECQLYPKRSDKGGKPKKDKKNKYANKKARRNDRRADD